MCSVQSSLLFVYYVVFSEMSVQYCLCVSTIQCTQCSLSVFRVGSVLQRSMQVVFRVYSISSVSLARSVYRVESVAYTVNGVQCQLGYSLRRSWPAYYFIQCWQCSVQYSVVSGVQSLQRSVSVQCLQRSGCVWFSGSFSVCTLQCLQCSEHWLFTKSLSCLWHVQSPHFAQLLNFSIPSATEGHLRTKYNVKKIIF